MDKKEDKLFIVIDKMINPEYQKNENDDKGHVEKLVEDREEQKSEE